MQPTTTTPPPPPAAHRHHHSSKKFKLKTTIHSVKSLISAHRCAWLAVTILLQLLLVLFLTCTSRPPLMTAAATSLRDESCKHGRIYVYDLPSMLNQDLLDDCDHLEPWGSRCNAVSNGGIGPPATGLVPANLSGAWHWTDKYMNEVIYHDRMKNYPCTTSDPAAAAAFYIPFYAGLAVGKFLWVNHTAKNQDIHATAMLEWVKEQPPWRRSNGSDHFLVLGRLWWEYKRRSDADSDWGTSLTLMPLMKNVLRLIVERDPWDPLEVSVPYATAFHPRSGSDIRQWQALIRARQRSSLFTFVGAVRDKVPNDFRRVLMDYCKGETTSCKLVDCSVTPCGDAPAMFEAFLDSDFCLQPKGDGLTRRSAFDCMLAGSIPVYFWTGSFEYQYEWHMPHRDASKYSIFIDHNIVRNDTSIIKRILERYSREKVTMMRENIIELLPKLLYSKSNANLGGIKDAFDIAMEGVLKRFQQQKMGGGLS